MKIRKIVCQLPNLIRLIPNGKNCLRDHFLLSAGYFNKELINDTWDKKCNHCLSLSTFHYNIPNKLN